MSEGDVEVLIPLWVFVVAYHPGPSHDRPSNADCRIWVASDHVLVIVVALAGPLIVAVSMMISLGLAPAMQEKGARTTVTRHQKCSENRSVLGRR